MSLIFNDSTALRTREFAEGEWSRLISSSTRDKVSFLSELKDINDRIIGLKQTLPPLNIPHTVSYQEKPKDYGFVVDSNMRVASASSLSNAKGLRENLSRMMTQQSQSTSYRPAEQSFTRKDMQKTDFDIISSTVHNDLVDRHTVSRNPPLRAQDGYFVPTTLQPHNSEEARKDAEFARALEAFRSRSVNPVDDSYFNRNEVLTSVVGDADRAQRGGSERMDANAVEEEEDSQVADNEELGEEEASEGEEGDEDEEWEQVPVPRISAPAVPPSVVPREDVPKKVPASMDTPVLEPVAVVPSNIMKSVSLPPAPPAPVTLLQVAGPVASERAVPPSKPSADIRPEPVQTAPTSVPEATLRSNPVGSLDQLSRLQAWELELQERERQMRQYRDSLTSPIGAKMIPKPLPADDSELEQDIFDRRYGSRSRREEPVSALRGSTDIHIHNHISPPSMPAFAPAPVPPRSSLYDSYQPSAYTPSKYEYAASGDLKREHAMPEVRPSIQTRYPQRSEIRSNYAFPPAPYSSLNSGSSNIDLSGLSLERMRELTGHY